MTKLLVFLYSWGLVTISNTCFSFSLNMCLQNFANIHIYHITTFYNSSLAINMFVAIIQCKVFRSNISIKMHINATQVKTQYLLNFLHNRFFFLKKMIRLCIVFGLTSSSSFIASRLLRKTLEAWENLLWYGPFSTLDLNDKGNFITLMPCSTQELLVYFLYCVLILTN